MNDRATAAYFFKQNNEHARDTFRATRDLDAYIAESVYNSAKLILDEMAIRNGKLKPVAYGATALRPIIRGAVDSFSHHMRAPDHNSDTHHDYFSEMRGYIEKHIGYEYDRLPDAAKQALHHLGVVAK